jgi:MFS family permease
MNFFALRVVLNLGFALSIVTFFMSNSMPGLITGAVIFGISNAGGDVAWGLWVTKLAPPERVADYMSVHTFFTGVRGVLAPIVAFQIAGVLSLATIGWICAAMIAAASVMLLPEIKWFRSARPGRRLVDQVSE